LITDDELRIENYWKENKIFEKSAELREKAPLWTFYDGPPTANGKPHIGHVETRAFKDLLPRYKTMKGFKVLRKAGWDTHGLPVELEVEKLLDINGKQQIESYGVEEFVKKCKSSVWHYENEWRKMSDRVAFWLDMDNPYVTYENDYIESVWWSLKTIWEKGLIYRGHRVAPYCPRCGTTLSSHEVAQGYAEIADTTVFAKFRIKGKDNEFIIAWTTTPWTLPSNVAIAVNAKEIYAKIYIKDFNEYFVLAKNLLGVVKEEYKIVDEFKGETLKGLFYEPLMDYAKPAGDKIGWRIVCDDYVNLTEGTGAVHIAPAFGEDDARLGRDYDLPFVQLVGPDGNFIKGCGDLTGVFIKDADKLIIKDLEKKGLLYKTEKYVHSYPFCWRCGTPLMYYARDAWFIKMSVLRENLVKNNNAVNWYPDNVKEGRFGNFLENVIDWSLSRERYWGTPLPIWECECGNRIAIGSIEELKSRSDNCPDDIELHKPYIDNVLVNCRDCGGKMKRVPEVIDCWYDSGSMPFAQYHYPFENKKEFEENFPAQFICEAIDQTRGWFYTLMAISTLIFDRAPYESVLVLGHVQDKDGKKMSKHVGNVVNPEKALDKHGADAVRWYFYSSAAPWLPKRYSDTAVDEARRKFISTYKNSFAFYDLYAKIDKFNPAANVLDYGALGAMDRWILSRLNSLIKFVDDSLEDYKITEAARAMSDFMEELSNWYIRRSRERFWAKGMEPDKVAAYSTLYAVLLAFSKLAAPFIPFAAEEVYLGIKEDSLPESVHLCEYPVSNGNLIDAELEKNMDVVLQIVSAGRSARNEANIKNRQPLAKMFVKSERVEELDVIKEELNVKSIEFTNDVSKYTGYNFKPQLKTLGPRYGKELGKVKEFLAAQNADFIEKLKDGVEFNCQTITKDDVLIETVKVQGYASGTYKQATAILDTTLTPELIEEGYVRELVSKIQTMRKESGFEVLDKIAVYYSAPDVVKNAFVKNEDFIKKEVLAEAIFEGNAEREWDINGVSALLSVKKLF
jgi:isoleucyl-tRNA synthetase